MAKKSTELLAFNRGIISPLMGGRVDVARRAMSASTMENWVPHSLGPMSLRPGLKYITGTHNSSLNTARYIPFVYSTTDTALIELSDYVMRVIANDVVLAQAAACTSAVANSGFASDLTSWTDADEGGTATSTWLTGGYLSLLGDGTNAAKRTQTVDVSADAAEVQYLRVVIARGPVTLRVGSAASGDQVVGEVVLDVGDHVFKVTLPSANIYIQLLNRGEFPALVDSIDFVG